MHELTCGSGSGSGTILRHSSNNHRSNDYADRDSRYRDPANGRTSGSAGPGCAA